MEFEYNVNRPEMLWKVLAMVHFSKNPREESYPALARYVTDELHRNSTIELILKGNKIGAFNAKLLNASCLLCGVEKSASVFARFIFLANNRDELKNFLSFALTVTPFFPNIMTLAIEELFNSIEKFVIEFSALLSPDTTAANAQSARFVNNLLTLIEWQNSVTKDESLKYLGICLADLKGDFLENLMAWGLTFVEKVSRKQELNEANASVIDNFLNLMRVVQPRVKLRLKHPNRLLVQFCGLIMALLKLVNKDNFCTVFDGVDFVYHCYAVTGVFFTCQVGASKNLLISSLFDEAFENSATLFGTPKDESRMSVDMVNYNPFSSGILLSPHLPNNSCFSTVSEEYSCLRELRSTPFGLRNAAAMAHSGVFSKRHCKVLQSNIGESETLRILLFVNMIDNLCIGSDGVSYDLETCRFLGEALIDRFCLDGITACFSWADWKTERECIPKYVEISKHLDFVPFVYDFLLILAEVGLAGLIFALPVIKAQFAVILVQLESTPLKDSKISSQNVLKISRLLSLFISANFKPKLLEIVFEIICLVTNHEAFIILLNFWNLIQSIVPDELQKKASINEVLNDSNLFTMGAGGDFVSMLVLVVQRNILQLSAFLPQIIEEIGSAPIGNTAEDDW